MPAQNMLVPRSWLEGVRRVQACLALRAWHSARGRCALLPWRSVALDPGEHALYAGGASGAIFELSLVGSNELDAGGAGGSAAAAAAAAAVGGSGEAQWVAMEGHSRPVTCLAFTGDAAHLVSGEGAVGVGRGGARRAIPRQLVVTPIEGRKGNSPPAAGNCLHPLTAVPRRAGSEDQSVRVWDLRSRQQVRLLPNPAKGPVTALLLLDRPPFMHVSTTWPRGPAPVVRCVIGSLLLSGSLAYC